MNKKLIILASFALCILFSNSVLAQKCTLDDYSIVNTIADSYTGADGITTFPYSIRSDGAGPYSTIKGNMDVMFQVCNSTHDFTMNLNMSKRVMKVTLSDGRLFDATFFNFDRVASVPVTDPNSAKFKAFCGVNADGSIKLYTKNSSNDNYAGCGFDGSGYYVRRVVGFQLGNGYSLRFQNSPIDSRGTLAAGTNYIKVYHPTSKIWTLSPEETQASTGSCAEKPQCGALIYTPNKGPAYVESYHSMPFEFSITSSKDYF
jgi:hypothetical protein